MKQPILGVVATGAIIVVSWIVILAMGPDLFMGWASFALMGAIPFAILVGAFWQSEQPPALGRLGQPGKGVTYLVLAALVGAVVTVIHWQLRGGGMSPPVPMAVMTIITSVVTMFFLAIAFGGWPFSLMKNKVVGGALLLITAYVINAVIFQVFFNFGFAAEAPFYRAALDPGGLFNAWDVVVVMVTALAVMFLFLCFDVWPITSIKAFRSQPVIGLVWTAACFGIGLLVFWLGTSVAGLPAPTFLVTAPIPFLFGAIVVLQMLGGSLFGKIAQPARGVLNAILAAVVGLVLAAIYRAMMPVLSGAMAAGPENDFAAELWLANALLAVTFPFLAFFGDFFGLWPLAGKQDRAADDEQPETATA
ncbi:hypothetical protein [Granulicoccus sp. GXG6511]|uniref:hypothetical protein n=1 Tax=Granulicoccus sp. GXG6511 TaxID=3381351 RepID=UPI003D7DCBC3